MGRREVQGSDEGDQPRQALGDAPATQLPGEEGGEHHEGAAGKGGQDMETYGRHAEDLGRESIEERRHRRLVDVAEGRVLAGRQVVELVAMQAVHGAGGEVERHLGHRQGDDPAQRQRR